MTRLQIDILLRQAQNAFNANQHRKAGAICEQILQRDGRNSPALNLLGQISFGRGALEEASTLLHRAVAAGPRDPLAHLALAELQIHQGSYGDAVKRYDKVLRLAPDHPRAIAGKAEAYEKSGDRDNARAVLAAHIRSGRASPEMTLVQARLELHDRNEPAVIDLLDRLAQRGDVPPDTLWHIFSVLGKALERSGRFDEAFDAYRRCNETISAPFSPEAWSRYTAELIETFSAERLATMPRAHNDSTRPVFIVGMPRSGSTLIEAILDAHPLVHGVGELATMQETVNGLSLKIGSSLAWPACAEDLDQQDVDDAAGVYLDRLTALNADAPRIADKYLLSYRHLGLIELLLPKARVIHSRRHPLDTCLSCFCETLSPVGHPYKLDLQHLGGVYLDYERLMTHWRRVLTIPILDVHYEDLVADQECSSRAIVEFCGLEWDDRCLRYYDTGRAFRTASYDQVNQPIYGSSVGRYKNFEKHLEPLTAVLAGGGSGAASKALGGDAGEG